MSLTVTGSTGSWPVVTSRRNSLKHGFSQDAVLMDTGVLTAWEEYIQVQVFVFQPFRIASSSPVDN
jgi:hypothetical protein